MKSTRVLAVVLFATVLMLPPVGHAQQGAVTDAAVDFGVFVSAPIPGTGCATTG